MDGTYTFATTSDDGSVRSVDGANTAVVNNNLFQGAASQDRDRHVDDPVPPWSCWPATKVPSGARIPVRVRPARRVDAIVGNSVLFNNNVYAAAQAYANNVTVTQTRTVYVTNSLAASAGTLAIGSNKLSLTGRERAGWTLGTATMSGNPTFETATNTTLTLVLGDGAAARTITKQGPGAMLATAAAGLVDGTQVNVAAGTLNSNHATALGTLRGSTWPAG